MFGFPLHESATPPAVFYSRVHPEDLLKLQDAISKSITSGSPYEAEFRIRHPTGAVRWIHGKGKVLFDEEGVPVRMVGINVDTTSRKIAEDQLLESNRHVQTLAGRLITAQESERRRVSHELHDDLSQKLALISVALSRLKRILPFQDSEVTDQLAQIYNHTTELSEDIRQLSHQLHPASLEHLGLAKALAAYIVEFENMEEIKTTFTAQLDHEKIPFEYSVCIYRVTLEALRNVARHSGAKSASVKLYQEGQVLILEVADSGVGFDVEVARRGSGIGLLSAEERIHLLQGIFEVQAAPGSGTRLIARIPLKWK